MPNAILSQTELKLLFDYDPESGALTWRNRPVEHFKSRQSFLAWNARFPGKTAGCINNQGYLQVRINGSLFKAHRIIYKIIHGTEPPEIDHINGARDCNCASNLRAATGKINQKNQRLPSNNTSGCIGVGWNKRDNKWVASINAEGTRKHLGYFDDKQGAINARQGAEIEYGFHPNHGKVRPL